MSLEFSSNAAARTNEAQRTAAEGARAFLPLLDGWQPLVRLQAVLHTVIHICRTLDPTASEAYAEIVLPRSAILTVSRNSLRRMQYRAHHRARRGIRVSTTT